MAYTASDYLSGKAKAQNATANNGQTQTAAQPTYYTASDYLSGKAKGAKIGQTTTPSTSMAGNSFSAALAKAQPVSMAGNSYSAALENAPKPSYLSQTMEGLGGFLTTGDSSKLAPLTDTIMQNRAEREYLSSLGYGNYTVDEYTKLQEQQRDAAQKNLDALYSKGTDSWTAEDYANQKAYKQQIEDYTKAYNDALSGAAFLDDTQKSRVAQLEEEQRALLDEQKKLSINYTAALDPISRDRVKEEQRRNQEALDAVRTELDGLDPSKTQYSGFERAKNTITGGIKTGAASGLNALNDVVNWLTKAQGYKMSPEESLALLMTGSDPTKVMESRRDFYNSAEQTAMREDVTKRIDALAESGEADIQRAKQNASAFGKFLVDAGVGGVQLAGDAILGAINPAYATAAMATRAFGGATQEARQAGAGEGKQLLYGLGSAALATTIGKAFDGLGGVYGKGWGDDFTNAIVAKLANTDKGRTIARFIVSNMGGEFTEEFTEGALEPVLKAIYDDGLALKEIYSSPEAWADALTENLYSGLIGAALGGVGGAVEIATGGADAKNAELRAIEAERAAAAAPVQSEATAAPTVEQTASPEVQPTAEPTAIDIVMDILEQGNVSNRQAENILNNPALLEAFNALPGITPTTEVTGKSAQRGVIKAAAAKMAQSAETTQGDAEIPPTAAETEAGQSGELNLPREATAEAQPAAKQQVNIDNATETPYNNSTNSYGGNASDTGRGFDTNSFGISGLRGTGDFGPQGRSGLERTPDNTGVVLLNEASRSRLIQSGVYAEVRESTADNAAFSFALENARNSDNVNGWAVSPKTAEELNSAGTRTFITENGGAGFAIAANGDIQAVFANRAMGAPKGVTRSTIPQAIAAGGDRLDCYGAGLVKLYSQYGFIPVARVAFDSDVANPGWDASKGTPDIYFMMHVGDSADDVVQKFGTYPKYTSEELLALPVMEYSEAEKYRDRLIAEKNTAQNTQPPATIDPIEVLTGVPAQQTQSRPAAEESAVPPNSEMVPTQTKSSDPLYTSEERNIEGLRPEDSVHVLHSDTQVDSEVDRRYAGNKDAEKAALFDGKSVWNDTDTALAHKFLAEAVAEARGTGDYSEVIKLQREWERQGTRGGQALRQRQRFSATPEAIIAEAAKTLYGEDSATRKLNPKQKEGIMEEVARLATAYNAIPSGDTAAVVDMIKQVSAIRRTSGLFNNEVSKRMASALDEVASLPDGEAFLRDVLTAQIRSVASDYAKPSVLNQIKQIRFLNMLSKLSTFARNIVANNVLDPMEVFANDIAVPLDILLSKFTGTRSITIDRGVFSKAKQQGKHEGFLKSFIQVGLDADVEDATSKYEDSKGRTFKMTGNWIERLLSTWEKYEGYALKTTDETKKGGIRAETQRGIDALREQGKISEDALTEWANETALERTLQSQGRVASALTGARKAFDNIAIRDNQGGQIGLGETIMLFANVPANATVKTIQFTPAGAIDNLKNLVVVLNAARNGKLTAEQQARFVQSIGRTITGSGLVYISTILALKGLIKVGGADDKNEEAAQKAQGLTGTQLNLSAVERWIKGEDTEWRDSDVLMNVGFLEQLNANLAMGAAIADAYRADENVSIKEIASANMDAAAQAVFELPALSTISDMVNAYEYSNADTTGGKIGDAALDFATNTAISYLVPNFMRGLATGTDNTVRDTYTSDSTMGEALDYLMAGIPGLREKLPAAVDSWGKEKTYTDNALLNFLNANVLPGAITKFKTSEVQDEVSRLAEAGIDGIFPDRKAPSSISVSDEKYELSAERQDAYLRQMGTLTEQYYKEFMDSPMYKGLSDEQRGEVLKELQNLANEKAKERAAEALKIEFEESSTANLKKPAEYVIAKELFSDAADRKDYDAIDALIDSFKSLNTENQAKLTEGNTAIKHLVALEGKVDAEPYFEAMDAKKAAEKAADSSADVVGLGGIRDADLTPEEEAAMVELLMGKTAASAYTAFTGTSHSIDDAIEFLGLTGSNKDGSASKSEQAAWVRSNYGSDFDRIWRIIYPPK